MSDSKLNPTDRASFTVRQGGMIVASGSGPYEAVVREAGHYAAIYGQDGPVKVSIRRRRMKNKTVVDVSSSNRMCI